MDIDFSAVTPEEVTLHVGARIRTIRRALGYSPQALGEILGITPSQVRKYERGDDRISVAYLFRLSEAFDVPIECFYLGLPTTGDAANGEPGFERLRELIDAFYRIDEPVIRQELVAVLRTLWPAQTSGGDKTEC